MYCARLARETNTSIRSSSVATNNSRSAILSGSSPTFANCLWSIGGPSGRTSGRCASAQMPSSLSRSSRRELNSSYITPWSTIVAMRIIAPRAPSAVLTSQSIQPSSPCLVFQYVVYPLSSIHLAIRCFKAIFGIKSVLSRTAPVKGEVGGSPRSLLVLNHFSIEDRSYVNPSRVKTGSNIISPVIEPIISGA